MPVGRGSVSVRPAHHAGGASRLALIDAIKGVAAQLIVLHHLAFYGPMSDSALPLAPELLQWFYDHGRLAVQAFLVVGGFLAARWLAPEGVLITRKPLRLIVRRYRSIAPPLLVALLLAIAAAAFARELIAHDTIPPAPGMWQLLAHALLIQGIAGVESLSAGVWYIAIDFQLFVLLLALLTISRNRLVNWSLASLLTIASLFYFNRHPEFDDWGPYFFGAYGLGAFAYWSSRRQHSWFWMLLLLAVGIAALWWDFRIRIAVALVIAGVLAFASHAHLLAQPKARLFAWMGQISYSLFLVHFPVILVVGSLAHHFAPGDPVPNFIGMVCAWFASLAGAAGFHRWVELPLRPRGRL